MTTYIKDNVPAAWAEGEACLWHKVASVLFTEHVDHDVFITACGRRIASGAVEVIHQEMTLAKWDERFGDDVDLCACAVNPADLSGSGK